MDPASPMSDLLIHTLHIARCPVGPHCPSVHRVAGQPGYYLIGKRVADDAMVAAFADMVAPDEVLSWVPDEVLPELGVESTVRIQGPPLAGRVFE
jgi:hypothetical protein